MRSLPPGSPRCLISDLRPCPHRSESSWRLCRLRASGGPAVGSGSGLRAPWRRLPSSAHAESANHEVLRKGVPLPEEKAAFEVEEKVDTQNTRGPTPLGMGEQRHSAASFLEATRNVRFVPGRPREPEKPLCVTRGPPRGESSLFASKSFGIPRSHGESSYRDESCAFPRPTASRAWPSVSLRLRPSLQTLGRRPERRALRLSQGRVVRKGATSIPRRRWRRDGGVASLRISSPQERANPTGDCRRTAARGAADGQGRRRT